MPAGFLVAEFLVHSPLVGGARGQGRARLAVVLALFAVGNLGIACQNLYRDTHPFRVTPGQDAKPLPLAGTPQTSGAGASLQRVGEVLRPESLQQGIGLGGDVAASIGLG